MSTKFTFGGKKIVLPGSYSRIVSGVNAPQTTLDYGKVLIIDNTSLYTGVTGNGILGGAGVAGELASGKNAIYKLSSIREAKDFCPYGWWSKGMEFLFKPGFGVGASEVYVIKPATTTSASMTFTATGGGSNGGTFKVKTRDEGLAANGVGIGTTTYTALYSGYAFNITAGVINSSKWILNIWRGTYTGLAEDNIPYDGVALSAASRRPKLIISSPEFDNIQTLIDWATSNSEFQKYFYLDPTSAIAGDGSVVANDVSSYANYNPASGGTETYDKIDEALEVVKDLDYSFVITTYASNPQSDASVLKIKNHINDEAKFEHILQVYAASETFADAVTSAEALNSESIEITYGKVKKSSPDYPTGLRTWSSFYHMCLQVGRLCGLAPQVPLTFKKIDINGLVTQLTDYQLEQALDSGVRVATYDPIVSGFVVLQDVNTLQDNEYVVNPDGTTHQTSLKRIKMQLNRELIIFSRRELLANPEGVNRNTLSEVDVVDWTKGYLQRRIATKDSDNLIISYGNVTATREQDALYVNYEFEPNSQIRIVMFTGIMI